MSQDDEVTSLSWDLIRAFLALDRCGDYEAAAEMAHIDDSTMRRRIRMLERRARRTLFVRDERGWKVSPDQGELVNAALRMEEAARLFTPEHQEGAGIVRITVLDAFAQRFGSAFGELRARHPRLTLNITTETYFVNLKQEQVDIAIRLAQPMRDGSSLRIRKIGVVRVNAYASRRYFERMDGEANRPDFAAHELLAMNVGFPHHDHNFTYADLDWKDFGLRGQVIVWSDSFIFLARMCEAGYGVAILPTMLAADYSDLQLVYPKRSDLTTELWMVSRFDLRAAWQRNLADMLQAEVSRWSN